MKLNAERPADINLVRHLLHTWLHEHQADDEELTLTREEAATLCNDIDRSWARLSSD